ncbi:MAG TPA: peptidylprolyl isomerase [Polyangia bacterium]|jgi:parvulin-like peptidyl-prolyl isomerase|nr:peptidylprolyl isomerase [Polyangia bacterium]
MRIVGALVGVLGLGALGTARAGESVVVERVIAVINNEIILLSDLRDRATLLGQPLDERVLYNPQALGDRQIRQLLDRMVDDSLILQQAHELKLTIEKAEVDRAIEEVRKQNGLSEDQFREVLSQQGYSWDSYRHELRNQLLRFKVINTAVRAHVNISDEDVRSFYNQSVRQAGSNRSVHLRHVLITVPPNADAKAQAERRAHATRVLEEARASKNLGEFAKEHSDDELTRDKEGDLGWVSEKDGLPEKFAEVVFAMDVGEVRGPIRTDRGFEVVQLLERKDSDARPFDEVKEQIRQQLSSQQLEKQTQSWLMDLRKKAHVDLRL